MESTYGEEETIKELEEGITGENREAEEEEDMTDMEAVMTTVIMIIIVHRRMVRHRAGTDMTIVGVMTTIVIYAVNDLTDIMVMIGAPKAEGDTVIAGEDPRLVDPDLIFLIILLQFMPDLLPHYHQPSQMMWRLYALSRAQETMQK